MMTWIVARGHYGSKLTAASLICNDVKIQFKFGQMVVPVSKVVVPGLAPGGAHCNVQYGYTDRSSRLQID
jgi:hypothetical protein